MLLSSHLVCLYTDYSLGLVPIRRLYGGISIGETHRSLGSVFFNPLGHCHALQGDDDASFFGAIKMRICVALL